MRGNFCYAACKPGGIPHFVRSDGAINRLVNQPRSWRERGAFHVEHFFICPYCGEQISVVVDLSVRRQTYIEDCEVCCKPIEITCGVEDGDLAAFHAKTLE